MILTFLEIDKTTAGDIYKYVTIDAESNSTCNIISIYYPIFWERIK